MTRARPAHDPRTTGSRHLHAMAYDYHDFLHVWTQEGITYYHSQVRNQPFSRHGCFDSSELGLVEPWLGHISILQILLPSRGIQIARHSYFALTRSRENTNHGSTKFASHNDEAYLKGTSREE